MSDSPRLLDRVREQIRTRHYSKRTEEIYVHWIKRFIPFHGKRHPVEMGAPEVGSFLTSLATDRNVAAFVRHAPAGIGLRHPHGAGITRTFGHEHNDDLHACAQSGWPRDAEST